MCAAIQQVTPYVIEHKNEIIKNTKTWIGQCLVFKSQLKKFQKFLFFKGHVFIQKPLCQVEADISLKCFYLVTHSTSLVFDRNAFFMKLGTFFILKPWKMVRSSKTFFVSLLTSAVTFKQILLHGSKIVQYF